MDECRNADGNGPNPFGSNPMRFQAPPRPPWGSVCVANKRDNVLPHKPIIINHGSDYMAYIYKIINDINDKVYVGKTVQTQEERFSEHIRAAKKNEVKNRPLYYAIRKYGIEHFSIQQIEECSVNEVNEREIYWIEKQDSYNSGYNATKGGEGKFKYNYDLIYSLYKKGYTASRIAKELNYDVSSCIDILCYIGISHNEIRKRGNDSKKKPVKQINASTGEIIKTYLSIKEAAICCNIKCAGSIGNAARTGNLCGGFIWEFMK